MSSDSETQTLDARKARKRRRRANGVPDSDDTGVRQHARHDSGHSVREGADERKSRMRTADRPGPGRLMRYCMALTIVSAAAWAYQLILVPLVEPEIVRADGELHVPGQAPGRQTELSRLDLSKHFSASAWQRNAKVLETKYGAIVFGDDIRERLDGEERITLRPVTLLFVADGDGTHLGERPVILDCPEGIEVVTGLAEGENVSPLAIGAPVSGRLIGQVSIYRASSPGKDDGFKLATRDVQIDESRIATPYAVQFSMGRHHGAGRDLEIVLRNRDDESPAAMEVKGRTLPVTSLELVHLDKLVVYTRTKAAESTKGFGYHASGLQAQRLPPTKDQGDPVEVTCSGPLHVDLTRGIATLEDKIRIARIRARSGSAPAEGRGQAKAVDSLHCDWVEVSFGEGDEGDDSNGKLGGLVIRKVVASGRPVRLASSGQEAELTGEQLIYEAKTSMLSLLGSRGVRLQQAEHRVEAVRLDYQLNKDAPKRLGQLWATGPGRIHGVLGESQRFEATWSKLLKAQPQGEQHVISLFEAVRFGMGERGQFHADQVHLFLNETIRPPTQEHPKPRREFLPDRVHASGGVTVQSPKMSLRTREVQAWFQPELSAPRADLGVSAASESGGFLKLGDPRMGKSRVDATGRSVQLKLTYDHDMRISLDELHVNGAVNIVGPKESGKGFHIVGDVLTASGISSERLSVRLVGHPAKIDADNGHIESGSIQLDQAKNMLSAAGAGNLSFSQKLDGPDGPRLGPPIHIAWKERLWFDGGRLVLAGGVRISGERPLKDGKERMQFEGTASGLEAFLARGYSFADLKNLDGQKVEVRSIQLRDKVSFTGSSFASSDGSQISREQMLVREIQFAPKTNVIRAVGPGWLSTVRKRESSNQEGAASGPSQRRNDSSTLHYARIEFQDQISGNAKVRDLQFSNRIRCVYGEVSRWTEIVEDGTNRGMKGGELTCQRLRVAEAANGSDKAMFLDATGNIFIRSEQFDARAARLTYDQLKGLMVLHGEPRTGAQLRFLRGNGAAPIPMTSQRIMFWPKTKQVDIDGFSNASSPLSR